MVRVEVKKIPTVDRRTFREGMFIYKGVPISGNLIEQANLHASYILFV